MDRYIFELRGPEYDLASAEVKSILHTSGSVLGYGSEPVTVVEADDIPFKRLGLTHRVLNNGIVFSESTLFQDDIKLEIPSGSIAVVSRRLGGKKADSNKIKRKLGDLLSEDHEIDLDDPDHIILVLISDECYAGRVIYEIDKQEFRDRKVKNREFFSPISLEPWYARALVNLGRVSPGHHIHDPFCGTGGILIEAGTMGFKISGGDADRDMVEGCKLNLEQFDVSGEIVQGDVSETIPKGVDCVVTDPPYGRASTTNGEDIKYIYRRLFESCNENLKYGGYLSTIFPEERYVDMGKDHMEFIESYESRVHGSLKRIFCVFRS